MIHLDLLVLCQHLPLPYYDNKRVRISYVSFILYATRQRRQEALVIGSNSYAGGMSLSGWRSSLVGGDTVKVALKRKPCSNTQRVRLRERKWSNGKYPHLGGGWDHSPRLKGSQLRLPPSSVEV